MKLVTYETWQEQRIGVVEGDHIVDVGAALDAALGSLTPQEADINWARYSDALEVLEEAGVEPVDMISLLELGEEWRSALSVITGSLVKAFRPATGVPNPAPIGLLRPLASAKLRAPIARPGKITCVGLNYADHAHEQGIEPPKSPIFFLKASNIIIGPGDPIELPPNSQQPDYEAEFAVVMGKAGRRIPEERAYEYVAGYMILHDVTARDMQSGDKQWFRGKSCDTFAPTGPWIVTKDEVPDPHNLAISCTLNGQTMQDSNTSNLIFSVPYLVSYLSQSLSWEVGDLISTGTPPGVGVFRKPPVFLKAGDTVSVTVERLGTLTNPVVAP